MTMQPTTLDLGFKNDCCKNEYNLQWVNGDLIEWEEVICKKCKLGYVVPIYITREYENAEIVESSLKNEIPQEVISLVDGKLVSSVDGEIKKPNLDTYWTEQLTHTYDGYGLNCKDITKEKRYSYINLCSDLVDHYDFVDSSWYNNLVPSMNFEISEDVYCWIGFPNSEITDVDEEEWNTFNLHFSDDSNSKEWIEHYQDFDTIEDLLGFIKSNWEVK